MKLKVLKPTEIDASFIQISAPFSPDHDTLPADLPGRSGDYWEVVVAVDNGQIQNWPVGRVENVYLKVVDRGSYALLNHCGKTVAEIENNYVPRCIPNAWGDYLDFDIDGTGTIRAWGRYCIPENIRAAFFPGELE